MHGEPTMVLKHRDTISAVCPSSVHTSVPVSTSHSLAVLSMDPVAITAQSGPLSITVSS